jgi:hypothetical protein
MNRGETAPRQANWLPALRTYLALSLGLHLLWETVQLPLYTIWTAGTTGSKAFAVVHCALGALMIAALSFIASLVVAGSASWPSKRAREVFALTIAFGIAYAIYSERLNTTVRQGWAYSPLMPVLPLTGTGLSPLLQWLVVPSLALAFATRQHCR